MNKIITTLIVVAFFFSVVSTASADEAASWAEATWASAQEACDEASAAATAAAAEAVCFLAAAGRLGGVPHRGAIDSALSTAAFAAVNGRPKAAAEGEHAFREIKRWHKNHL